MLSMEANASPGNPVKWAFDMIGVLVIFLLVNDWYWYRVREHPQRASYSVTVSNGPSITTDYGTWFVSNTPGVLLYRTNYLR